MQAGGEQDAEDWDLGTGSNDKSHKLEKRSAPPAPLRDKSLKKSLRSDKLIKPSILTNMIPAQGISHIIAHTVNFLGPDSPVGSVARGSANEDFLKVK